MRVSRIIVLAVVAIVMLGRTASADLKSECEATDAGARYAANVPGQIERLLVESEAQARLWIRNGRKENPKLVRYLYPTLLPKDLHAACLLFKIRQAITEEQLFGDQRDRLGGEVIVISGRVIDIAPEPYRAITIRTSKKRELKVVMTTFWDRDELGADVEFIGYVAIAKPHANRPGESVVVSAIETKPGGVKAIMDTYVLPEIRKTRSPSPTASRQSAKSL